MYAEAYLEPSILSTVELFRENHEKTLLQMFDWILNTLLLLSFKVEKICRMSMLVLYSQSQLCQSQKFVIDLLVS